ncbi:MAG: gamma-glutamyl-gamma-aminobutyrate hydrolase family protein [Clostridia bacterium]|nr:gamma-glutamyl-gamma-aminobutyrate hydrolase family protein [Clostridia bacterium]
MRPVIGLVPLDDTKLNSLWMLNDYFDALYEAGAVPVMLSITDDEKDLASLAEKLDGLLITGGQDIDPALYGEEPHEKLGSLSRLRDKMETKLTDAFLKADKPVLGICRGMQFLNVYFGGTLYQDIPSQYETDIAHDMEKPYDRFVHAVTIKKGTRLADILHPGEIGVNSLHHQAIKDLAPGLTADAVSEDGLIEGIEHNDYSYVIGVQWHPEFMHLFNENSKLIFRSFTDAAKSKKSY